MKRNLKNIVTAASLSIAMVSTLFLGGCGQTDSTTGTSSDSSGVTQGDAATGSGLYYSTEASGITVELSTDKESYEAGEELHYTLNVINSKTGYTVSRVFASPSNADEFSEIGAPEFSGSAKTGESMSYSGTLVAFTDEEIEETEVLKESLSGDLTTLTFRPYLIVNYGGQDLTVRYILEVVMYQNRLEISAADRKTVQTVSCHDPSIIVGEDSEGKKCYYIFGSHRAWAKSYDLQNWSYFYNNLSTDYREILAEPAAWAAHGSDNYQVDGYMWAPDMIYNKEMGKWCMYLSVDGDNWYSSIVLLTADTIEGDWTYEGIVVYSGFRTADYYDETDVAKVTGETTIASRYTDKTWGNYYPNNIDACVFYDDDGNLWMSYGSWSGGIFMLQLDEATGLRDYSVSYEDSIHSDPYFGKKIAGGQYVSGEASYIQKIGDYYWLFMSYGGLTATGGYNVRVFRSETPDGDYVDELGNTPYFDTYSLNINTSVGVRLFGGYKWRTMTQGQVAQGHNSAFVDDDGKAYIVFHTRTTDGSEGHYVKTHQLFVNEDGWLVAAPYYTTGESLDPSMATVDNVAGEYDLIIHNLNIDYAKLEVNKPISVSLNSDGTISGDKEGTWELKEGTSYIDLTFDGVTYKGVTLNMDVEGSTINTVVFTALGDTNQITIWGTKLWE